MILKVIDAFSGGGSSEPGSRYGGSIQHRQQSVFKHGKAEMIIKALKKPVLILLGVALVFFNSWAEDPILRDDHPDSHEVVKGDTLWDIANRFLNNPWMWPELWHANPQIENPHLIYPGDMIKLVYMEGEPRLTVKRGDRTYKMSPGDVKLKPKIHVMPLEQPIPAIPLDIIDPFLSSSRVLDPGVLESAPYVVQGTQRHVISGKGSSLFARGEFDRTIEAYGFFRKGQVLIDPVTEEILGIHAKDIGTGKLSRITGDIATVDVVRSTQEVRPGDRMIADEERRVQSIFYPSPPETQIDGVIIGREEGVDQIGYMDVVIINRGEREGLKSGNVLAILEQGEVVRDPITEKEVKLPEERAGLCMVFVDYEQVSYALVLTADRPLEVGAKVRNP
jgi:nucleoid-associated protein YgaU